MKQSYQTRRLLALRDIRHDGQNAAVGEEVFATEIDARYLIRSGAARDPNEVAEVGGRQETLKIQKVVASTMPARGKPGPKPKAPAAPAPAPIASTGAMTAAGSGLTGVPLSGGDGEQDADGGDGDKKGAEGAGESGDQTAG